MEQAADQLKKDVEKGKVTAEQIARDLRRVIHEAQELIKDTSHRQFAAKAEAASRSIQHGTEQLRHAYEHNVAMAEDAIDYGRTHVRENPLASIGIAMGVGALLALLFSRRD